MLLIQRPEGVSILACQVCRPFQSRMRYRQGARRVQWVNEDPGRAWRTHGAGRTRCIERHACKGGPSTASSRLAPPDRWHASVSVHLPAINTQDEHRGLRQAWQIWVVATAVHSLNDDRNMVIGGNTGKASRTCLDRSCVHLQPIGMSLFVTPRVAWSPVYTTVRLDALTNHSVEQV